MLQVICGNNRVSVQDKLETTLEKLLAKRKKAEISYFDSENFSLGFFLGFIGGAGLFESKNIIVIKYPKETLEVWNEIFEIIPGLAESDNAFVILEKTLSAEEKKKIKKYAHSLEEIKEQKGENEKGKDLFPIANLVGKRDKKNSWILYRSLLKEGIPPEKIFNIIFWQVKTLCIANKSKNFKEAGMKPFSFSSGKKFAENWTDEERALLIPKLVDIYHQSRRGGLPLGLALEKFILTL